MAMRSTTTAPAFELTSFGIERELEYTQHITLATHLVPVMRRTFASADETHIRIWGPGGDVVKTTFPSNRRSMVCAMTYCPTYTALLTTEVDMTLKAYNIRTLDLLDTFSLGNARKKGEKSQANEKVSAMVYLPEHDWVLVGGENGCDLFRMSKSTQRRTGSVGRLEHHLKLEMVRRVTADAVLNVVADLIEKRVIIWGPLSLSIYDTELSLITAFQRPHTEPVRCACIQILSILDTALLTGGEDGAVNFWTIQGRQAQSELEEVDPNGPTASMRLEHSFRGHTRTVEVVCFYHRKETGMTQRLCVSYARDGKMKVWSLIQFSLVYTLDVNFLDSKVSIFPLSQHFFAVAALASGGAMHGQRTTLTLVRFTAHMASPFATTNQSPVVLISRPPLPTVLPQTKEQEEPKEEQLHDTATVSEQERAKGPYGDDELKGKPHLTRTDTSIVRPVSLAGAVALVSEDVAIRIVDAEEKRVIATLPPPPNSKVQVLSVFLVPVWQLLILWLSSQEIAIFFVPTAGTAKAKDGKDSSDAERRLGDNRAVKSTTPLLIRRFSILEVRAHTFDKELPKEAFRSVALHHGRPLPSLDAANQVGFDTGQQSSTSSSPKAKHDARAGDPDWFLVIGTKSGTLQAFQLCHILDASPIWGKIAKHLAPGAWNQPARSAEQSVPPWLGSSVASEIEKQRLQAFEEELLAAMETARVPGQRPFPRDAPPVRFHGRWRCHDYFIEITEAVSDRILTLDMKRNLKIWHVGTMHCVFRHRLGEFSCYAPYLQPEPAFSDCLSLRSSAVSSPRSPRRSSWSSMIAEKASTGRGSDGNRDVEKLGLTGLALGNVSGSMQLMMVDSSDSEEPEVLQSAASHTKAITQIDFIWPINVFASIGKDDTIKIWTHGLVLLREIFFPQPLTAMSFRQRSDFASDLGHGDILLGFACHVEELKVDYWARGAETLIGKTAERGHGAESRMSGATKRGLPMLDISDDIMDHQMWLHAEDPNSVRRYMLDRKGVNLQGAAFVSRFLGAMIDTVRSPAPDRADEAVARLKNGAVNDFRGDPLIEVGLLSVGVADQSVLEVSKRRSKEPLNKHKSSDYHDRGDFSIITHAHPGYYDKLVEPSTIVDAPRENAIRGSGDPDDTAVITSIGIRHIGTRQEDEGGKETRPPNSRPISAGPDKAERAAASEPSAGKAVPKPEPPKHPRSKQSSRPSRRELQQQPTVERTASPKAAQSRKSQASIHDQGKEPVERGDEPWRNRRIGRGVPRTENVTRPTLQTVANTDDDPAKLLNDRRDLCEVPDLPEENLLKSLMTRKAEWLYSPADSDILANKRNTIHNMVQTKGKGQTWTPAGRLVCGEQPPAQAIMMPVGPLPHMLKTRTPMTRSEVTEQRIIEAAQLPPAPPPIFTIEARAPALASRNTPGAGPARQDAVQVAEHATTPASARASASPAGTRGRSPARAVQQGLVSNAIDAAAGVPLTAR